MPDVCKVTGCRDKSKHFKGSAVFSLPNDPDLRMKWLEFLSIVDGCVVVKSAKIFSYHFEEKCIKRNRKRMRLTRSAVPTLHPPKVCLRDRGRMKDTNAEVALNTVDSKDPIDFVNCSVHSDLNVKEELLSVEVKIEIIPDPLSV